MGMIAFVRNYRDLSTDRGFQFTFNCDKCGNGHMSAFRRSFTGTLAGLARIASIFLGGIFRGGARSAYEIQRTVGGEEHDAALRAAVEAAKGHFRQCSHCSKWVCPEVCWNHSRGLCEGCAPDVQETIATAQARATADQIRREASAVASADWRKVAGADVDLATPATASCPTCGACPAPGAKFCRGCGSELRPRTTCTECSAPTPTGSRYCDACGHAKAA